MKPIFLMTFLLTVAAASASAVAGDLRFTVDYPGLAKALQAGDETDWMFCGDEKFNLGSKNVARHFFVGSAKTGVVIKGLSEWQLRQWTKQLSASDLNKRILQVLPSNVDGRHITHQYQ